MKLGISLTLSREKYSYAATVPTSEASALRVRMQDRFARPQRSGSELRRIGLGPTRTKILSLVDRTTLIELLAQPME
jgi:hypothetical protein